MIASHWRRSMFLTLALGWMGFIVYLSSQSNPVDLSPVIGAAARRSTPEIAAAVSHMAEFGILALLLRWGLVFRRPSLLMYLGVFAFTMAFAVSDEIHQSFTPGRVSSVRDVFIDGFGAIVVLSLWRAVEVIVPWPLGHARSPQG